MSTCLVDKDGSFSLVTNIPIAPYTGYQHGRIDSSVIAHAASYARRSAMHHRWLSDVQKSITESGDATLFIVANDVATLCSSVSPLKRNRNTDESVTPEDQPPPAPLGPDELCFAVSSLASVGGSSLTMQTEVYLQRLPANETSDTIGWFIPNSGAHVDARRISDSDADGMINFLLSPTSATDEGTVLPLAVPIGVVETVYVVISLSTRRSMPLPPETRSQLLKMVRGPKQEAMTETKKLSLVGTALKRFSEEVVRRLWGQRTSIDVAAAAVVLKHFKTVVQPLHDYRRLALEGDGGSKSPPPSLSMSSDAGRGPWRWGYITRFPLRPDDFDFNRHVNNNSYIAFVFNAVKFAMRDYVDYVSTAPASTSEEQDEEKTLSDTEYHRHHMGALLVARGYKSVVSLPPSVPLPAAADPFPAGTHVSGSLSPQGVGPPSIAKRPMSVEESVTRSRLDYLREINDLHATLEVSMMARLITANGSIEEQAQDIKSYIQIQYSISVPPSPGASKDARGEATKAVGEMLLAAPTLSGPYEQ